MQVLVHCCLKGHYNNDGDNKTMTTTLIATTLIADLYIWLYIEFWLFLPQEQRATVPIALLWLVRQHGSLCQHRYMITH